MPEIEYRDLQRLYGGRYVAQRDGKVIAAAETYDDLSKQLEDAATEWSGLLIEYIEPHDVVRIY
jgi:hypothetical protein